MKYTSYHELSVMLSWRGFCTQESTTSLWLKDSIAAVQSHDSIAHRKPWRHLDSSRWLGKTRWEKLWGRIL